MKQRFDAIVENGLLRPLEPISLPDRATVVVTVESGQGDALADHDATEWARGEGDASISLAEVRRRLAAVSGSLSEVVIAERGEY